MVRIRRAGEDDLLPLAELFSVTARHLMQRYGPAEVWPPALEPEARLPLYRHLLRTGAMFVAEDPAPVGFSAAVVRDGVWFLSQLWVRPERHAGGIGSELLDEALAWGRGASAFSVISSPHPAAQLLYLRASMYPMWVQLDMTGSDAPAPDVPEGVEDLGEEDRGWVADLDREVRGIARPEDHAFWRTEARGVALRRTGGPAGYVYVWPGGKVGPGGAREPGDVPVLLRAAWHIAGGPVSIAVPSTNWSALRELVRMGLAPVGANTFMASRPLPDGSRYLSSGGALA